MENVVIDFQHLPWKSIKPGIRSKEYFEGSRRMRLIEFMGEFSDEQWCTEAHTGFVLEGRLTVHFTNKVIHFKAGEGVVISGGEENKHRSHIPRGEKVIVVFIEKQNTPRRDSKVSQVRITH